MERFGGKSISTPRTPIWLCLALIGLAAWMYLSQANAVASANAQLQTLAASQQQLTAQHQAALEALGQAEAPGEILRAAQALGMQPGTWGDPGNMGGQP